MAISSIFKVSNNGSRYSHTFDPLLFLLPYHPSDLFCSQPFPVPRACMIALCPTWTIQNNFPYCELLNLNHIYRAPFAMWGNIFVGRAYLGANILSHRIRSLICLWLNSSLLLRPNLIYFHTSPFSKWSSTTIWGYVRWKVDISELSIFYLLNYSFIQ